jgi:hypothetical protein
MAFPKVPRKPVTGKLNLTVRAPVEVVAGDTPPETDSPPGPDLSGELTFKVPRGFTMSSDPVDVVTDQRKLVGRKLDELRAKRDTCGACRKATSEAMLDTMEDILFAATDWCMSQSITVKIDFRQEKDGSLLAYFETPQRTLGTRVRTSAVEIGYYLENGLSKEHKYRLEGFTPVKCVEWLVGVDNG